MAVVDPIPSPSATAARTATERALFQDRSACQTMETIIPDSPPAQLLRAPSFAPEPAAALPAYNHPRSNMHTSLSAAVFGVLACAGLFAADPAFESLWQYQEI